MTAVPLPPVTVPAPPEPRLRADLRVLAVVSAVVTLLGLPAGVGWALLSPTPEVQIGPDGPSVPENKTWFAGDGWFLVVGALVGLACAFVAYRWTRRHGVATVVGLAVGGLLGSLIAWRLGLWLSHHWFDPAPARPPATGTYRLPLELRAKGVLFGWPLVAVIASFGMVAGLQRPEPAPYPRPGEAGSDPNPWAPPAS